VRHRVTVSHEVDGEVVPYEQQGEDQTDSPAGSTRRDELPRGTSSRDQVGARRVDGAPSARVDVPGLKELRRKLAWAVGSTYRVSYRDYRAWPAEYALLAANRLVQIHGAPGSERSEGPSEVR